MGLVFGRNRWVLAGGRGNPEFLGSSLAVLMWKFEKFVPKSLGCSSDPSERDFGEWPQQQVKEGCCPNRDV